MAPPSPHRSSILNLFKAGVPPVDIIKRLGVPSRTVYDSISRFKKLGTFLDRCGRGKKPTVVTPDRIKAVKERIRRNPQHQKNGEGQAETYLLPCKKAAILSEATTKKRLERSKKLLQRTRNGEHLVTVFSDEKLFTLQAEFNPQNHRVLAETSEEAFANGRTIHQASHPASVMVFGAVCADGKSPLLFVDQGVKINKEVYISQILEKTLLPWAQKHFNGRRWVFQQDGAPAHTAKLSQQWCETHLPAFIPKDEWPPSSPDLNPLDYSIWGVLQNKVNAKPHSSIEALKKTLVKEWDALSPEYLRATIDAYPRRLRAVIEKRGGRMEQY
ncbi:hypothetical protein CRE_29174 [Caenorhabditis remanei]|uniref:Tc1-like transposase DDE domain-containing protein n=1 Tax=Caenorhabditis remanei TaxID=31234 RepID=E3ND45_CAERE|nr:hypothetical protein CRE_29174 [Caenorhabditis remanei]